MHFCCLFPSKVKLKFNLCFIGCARYQTLDILTPNPPRQGMMSLSKHSITTFKTCWLNFTGGLGLMLLLSLTLTVKHNDVEPRGRGLPASAATLSRGWRGRVPKMMLGVNHSRVIVTDIFPRIYDKGNIHRSKGNRSAMTKRLIGYSLSDVLRCCFFGDVFLVGESGRDNCCGWEGQPLK